LERWERERCVREGGEEVEELRQGWVELVMRETRLITPPPSPSSACLLLSLHATLLMVLIDLIKVALVAIALFLVAIIAIGFFIIPRPHHSSALTPATVTEIHDALSWERDRGRDRGE
jgi:hypothetical protein